MKSINSFQARRKKFIGEINHGKSETIPNQAITGAELLRRFATGQPLGFKNVTPVYDDPETDDIPEFYKMSKLDRLHALQENSERVKDAKESLRAYQQAQQKLQQEQINKQEGKKETDTQPTAKSDSLPATS